MYSNPTQPEHNPISLFLPHLTFISSLVCLNSRLSRFTEDEETDESELETPEERAQRVDRERARKFEQDIKRVCEEDEDEEDEEEEDEEDDDEEEEDEGEKTGTALDYVHLESLMNVLGVRNKWGGNVPRRFITAVFISGGRPPLLLISYLFSLVIGFCLL